MNTIANSPQNRARLAMRQVNPALVEKFTSVYKFLLIHPEQAASKKYRSVAALKKEEAIVKLVAAFARGRQVQPPAASVTIPDEVVKIALEQYFGVPVADLEQAVTWHKNAMQAENMVGDILERYLANALEARGWVWCAGSVVRAVDFIKPGRTYQLLQVKNRSNSENSSSSAIREGTNIKKWFRSDANTGMTNWGAFPDASLRATLSESAFREHAIRYLRELRSLEQR